MEFLLALLYIGVNMTPHYTSNMLAGDARALMILFCATFGKEGEGVLMMLRSRTLDRLRVSSQCILITCSTNTARLTVVSQGLRTEQLSWDKHWSSRVSM